MVRAKPVEQLNLGPLGVAGKLRLMEDERLILLKGTPRMTPAFDIPLDMIVGVEVRHQGVLFDYLDVLGVGTRLASVALAPQHAEKVRAWIADHLSARR